MRKASTPQIAKNQSALAAALGVSRACVSHWLKDPRWPQAWRGPFDIEQVRQWRAVNMAPLDGADEIIQGAVGKIVSATQIAKLQVLVERAANLKVDRLIKEREYVKRSDVELSMIKKCEAVRVSLMQVGRSLRGVLANQPPERVEQILNDALRAICEAFAGQNSKGDPANPGLAEQEQES